MYGEKYVLNCEDCIDGIFTAVYDGWRFRAGGREVEIRTEPSQDVELFCSYGVAETDAGKAEKVARSIRQKLGGEIYEHICYAAVSRHPGKGTAIFGVLWQALGEKRCNRRVMENLADRDVNLVFALHRKVWHEQHRFCGFVRFREIGGGVLFSQISPENDVLEMLGPHFADRFPNESWMIYDAKRNKVLLHPKGQECTVRVGVELDESRRGELARPENYEQMWKAFCTSIAVEERRNSRRQQQSIPLKFRDNMLEFQERSG